MDMNSDDTSISLPELNQKNIFEAEKLLKY